MASFIGAQKIVRGFQREKGAKERDAGELTRIYLGPRTKMNACNSSQRRIGHKKASENLPENLPTTAQSGLQPDVLGLTRIQIFGWV